MHTHMNKQKKIKKQNQKKSNDIIKHLYSEAPGKQTTI
jgi:hypothetical protein